MKTTMKWVPLMVMVLAAGGLVASFILPNETMGLSLVVAGVAVALSAVIKVKGPLRRRSTSPRMNASGVGVIAPISMLSALWP